MLNLENRLVKIINYRGVVKSRIVRIMTVRDTLLTPLLVKSLKQNPELRRGRYLLTVHDLDKNEFRSYYHNYVKFTELGWFRKLYYRVCQWWENN